jgi:hypothetical protein
VLDWTLQQQLVPFMKDMVPLPGTWAMHAMPCCALPCMPCHAMPCHAMPCSLSVSLRGSSRLLVGQVMALCLSWSAHLPHAGIYDPDFIAANQEERADNIIKGSKAEQVHTVRRQIREFKASNGVDKVVVLWTANTERYAQVWQR